MEGKKHMLLLNSTHFKQQNRRVIEAIGPVDTYHPKIFCVTGSAKNATNLHYNMLFLSIVNPLPLPPALQNNIRYGI